LAEPGGLIRLFVDLGPKMDALLDRYGTRGGASEYWQRLRAAFEPVAAGAEAPRPVTTPTPVHEHAAPANWPPTDGLLEPLSSRELDVLLLLSERLTDKEIARELVVSPQTVKRHAANIYQKLDVGNRREAVAKATACGLLPPAPRRATVLARP